VSDINGDGVDDLIAGAPFAGRVPGTPVGGPRTTLGEVYVVFGSSQLSDRIDVSSDEQDVTFSGAKELDTFGNALAVGDINGDGQDDIIITAKGVDVDSRLSVGAAYVFFGSQSLTSKLTAADADITVLGVDDNDALGEAVGSGDLNGDGIFDFVLTSSTASGPDNEREVSGEAHVIFGSASIEGEIDLASSGPDATIYGVDIGDLFASSLVVADLNADGRVDIMLGAPFASGVGNARDLAGEVYAISGDNVKGIIDLRRDSEDAFVIFGGESEDGLGSGLAVLDINGDGVSEVAFAVPRSAGSGGQVGKLYIVQLP
jgi:hypothetical protein